MFPKRSYCTTLFWTVIFMQNYCNEVEGGRGSTWFAWTSEQLMEEAEDMFKDGNIPRALSFALSAVERAKIPKSQYHELVGKCYLRLNEANEAIDSFVAALKITPENEEVRVLLAEALFDSERYSEAVDQILLASDNQLLNMSTKFGEAELLKQLVRCYDEMIKRHPDEAEYYELRGKSHMNGKNFHDAISDFQTALSKNAQDENTIKELLSKALFNDGRIDEIETKMLAGLGNEFYATEKFEKALQCYDELTSRKPKLAEVHWRRALCFEKIDDLQSAVVAFGEMIQLPGHQLHYRIDFADVLHEVGNDAYAKEVLQDLSEKNLWDDDYTRMQEILQKIQGNIQVETEDLITQ